MAIAASSSYKPAFYPPSATASVAFADPGAPSSISETRDDPADPQDVLAHRKQDALDKLDRARKELELLRSLGGTEQLIAGKAKDIAERIGKAAVEYGDAARGVRGSASTAPDQPTDASARDASATASSGSAAAPDAATAAAGVSAGGTGTASDTIAAPSVKTDADAAKEFSDAAKAVKQVFEELVLKRRIKHTDSRDWVEAERARAKTEQEIQDLSIQIQSGQTVAVSADGAGLQTSGSVSVDILA
jgi:hypothetical protein